MQVGAAERRSTLTGGAKVPSGRSRLDSIMRKPSSQAADSVPAVATCPRPRLPSPIYKLQYYPGHVTLPQQSPSTHINISSAVPPAVQRRCRHYVDLVKQTLASSSMLQLNKSSHKPNVQRGSMLSAAKRPPELSFQRPFCTPEDPQSKTALIGSCTGQA